MPLVHLREQPPHHQRRNVLPHTPRWEHGTSGNRGVEPRIGRQAANDESERPAPQAPRGPTHAPARRGLERYLQDAAKAGEEEESADRQRSGDRGHAQFAEDVEETGEDEYEREERGGDVWEVEEFERRGGG